MFLSVTVVCDGRFINVIGPFKAMVYSDLRPANRSSIANKAS